MLDFAPRALPVAAGGVMAPSCVYAMQIVPIRRTHPP